MKLNEVDQLAIQNRDDVFLLEKGAKFYRAQDFAKAVAYYRLAAALGNMQALSNLGYCYMYGRSVEKDMNLALAYFQISGNAGIIDSLYKLGDIYERGKGVEKDEELAVYQYHKALEKIEADYEADELQYPSVYFALGRAHMNEHIFPVDYAKAYEYLEVARDGYENAIDEGQSYYKENLKAVEALLEKTVFDKYRETMEDFMRNCFLNRGSVEDRTQE